MPQTHYPLLLTSNLSSLMRPKSNICIFVYQIIITVKITLKTSLATFWPKYSKIFSKFLLGISRKFLENILTNLCYFREIQNNFVKISCFAKFQKCCFAVTLNAASLSFSFVFLYMFSCRVGWSDFHVVLNCIRNLISKFRFLELVFA